MTPAYVLLAHARMVLSSCVWSVLRTRIAGLEYVVWGAVRGVVVAAVWAHVFGAGGFEGLIFCSIRVSIVWISFRAVGVC